MADSVVGRPGWRGKPLKAASIHSHLADRSLLPLNSPADAKYITAYAPASGHFLSVIPSATGKEIAECITKAQIAQFHWRSTTFAQRRRVMRSLLEWVVKEMEGISRIASRDTGKTSSSSLRPFVARTSELSRCWCTVVDAAFGEILTTAEKLRWVIAYGEQHLAPDSRPFVVPLFLATTLLISFHFQDQSPARPQGVASALRAARCCCCYCLLELSLVVAANRLQCADSFLCSLSQPAITHHCIAVYWKRHRRQTVRECRLVIPSLCQRRTIDPRRLRTPSRPRADRHLSSRHCRSAHW